MPWMNMFRMNWPPVKDMWKRLSVTRFLVWLSNEEEVIRVSPNPLGLTGVLRRPGKGHVKTDTRGECRLTSEQTVEGCSCKPRTPKLHGHHQKLQGPRRDSRPGFQREAGPADPWILDFGFPELWVSMYFYSKPPSLWYFFMATLGNKYTPLG